MSVSSLTKFTVPLDSDQSANAQGLLMPKLKYRFRALFENLGVSTPRTELTKQVMDITRPTINFEEMEIPVYNSRVYLAGKHNWEPITVNFRDDVNGAVSRLLGEQVQKQFDIMEQASAASGIDYKFITRFEILDGGNGASVANVLETWELYGCFIQNVNYNDLNYASAEPVTITASIRFDNAVQTPIGDGVGATVAREIGSVVTG
tara:strand:- start:1453 stop:2070 length:618 start_codon:yes stop_codon:yes gene_type:complete